MLDQLQQSDLAWNASRYDWMRAAADKESSLVAWSMWVIISGFATLAGLIILAGILTNVCVFATAVQAVDRFFRVVLVEDATGAFLTEWHEKALDLISGPQCAPGHAGRAVGLYFGEVSTVARIKAALAAFVPSTVAE